MIFKDQQGHSKQGFKVVSKMRGPNLIRSQRECCPSKNKMIHYRYYQWSNLTHPWIWMAIWPRSTDPLSTKQRTFPAPWQSGPAQIAEWMKTEVGLPIQNCDPECSTITWSSRITMAYHGIVAIFSASKESSLANSPRTLIFFWIKAMKLPKKNIVELQGFSTWTSNLRYKHIFWFASYLTGITQTFPLPQAAAVPWVLYKHQVVVAVDPGQKIQHTGCSWLFIPPFRCIGMFKGKSTGNPPK